MPQRHDLRYSMTPDAEKFRLHQAEELLREAGFVEHDDGTWHPGDDGNGAMP